MSTGGETEQPTGGETAQSTGGETDQPTASPKGGDDDQKTTDTKNTARRIVLATAVEGMPTKDNFEIVEVEVPALKEGEVLCKALFVTVDPYLRYMWGLSKEKGYSAEAGQVGEVLESKNEKYKKGDICLYYAPWQTQSVIDPNKKMDFGSWATMQKLEFPSGVSPSHALGALGMPGQTAYFGLLKCGTGGQTERPSQLQVRRLKEGHTVVLSAAAGAVGIILGQLAKVKGARVVGTAGTDEKLKMLTETMGFDAAINYKTYNTTEKMQEQLKAACPDGIDVYFDNTGDHVTEAVWDLLNPFSRVIICGQISQYNNTSEIKVPAFLMKLVGKGIRIEGLFVEHWVDQFDEFYKEMVPLVESGKIKAKETIIQGFDKIVDAFIGIFSGKSKGKIVVDLNS